MLNIPILPTLLEAWIKICAYYPLIKLGTPDVLHTVKGILMSVVFDKAEPTRCLRVPVQSHDQAFDFTASVIAVSLYL